ncbi:hypothetical protein E8E14_003512 [Neopestalotiopsis sp. 37M]|nr:hypothetical protein E8E14_003512 [Neopestalotiopsis sp. 37M]
MERSISHSIDAPLVVLTARRSHARPTMTSSSLPIVYQGTAYLCATHKESRARI